VLDKIGSVGRALAHVEVSIRTANGETLAPGKTGKIWLRGPKITPGY
jgi:fatty-acyl-CoA synthase